MGIESEPSSPGVLGPTPIPDIFDEVRFVELTPDRAIDILRTGVLLPHSTNNCGSPMISTETLEKSRQYTIEVELSASETVIAEISRSFGVEVDSAETLAAVNAQLARQIGRELQKSYHIKIGESIGVISSRTIQTPPDYYSSIDLQWEEAHSVGIARLGSLNSDAVYEVPFQYVTDMHLVQVAVNYHPCTENAANQAAAVTKILPGAMPSAGSIELLSPVNTECKNDVVFKWNAQPGVQYQVTTNSLGHDYQAVSNWIEGSTWQQNLPRDYWGSWEWFVVAKDGTQSTRATYIFNPHPKINGDTPCSDDRASALKELQVSNAPTATASPTSSQPIPTSPVVDEVEQVGATLTPETQFTMPIIEESSPTPLPPPLPPSLTPYPPPPLPTEFPTSTPEAIIPEVPTETPQSGYPPMPTQGAVYP